MVYSQRLRKKICFFQPHDTYGSIENYISMIVNSVCRVGSYNVFFFCPQGKQTDRLCREINNNAEIIRFNPKDKGWKKLIFFVRYFKKIKPYIIHFNDPNPIGMLAANFCGMKNKVITYHTPTLNINYNWKGKLTWKYAFTKDWNIIATTKGLKDVMVSRRNLLPNKISVIHYGVDKNKFEKKIAYTEIKRKLNIPQDSFVITNVARLCPQKAQDVLIKSIILLPEEILKNIIVLIVGRGASEKYLLNLISTLKLESKVRLLGHREDTPNILACTDIFVLSSAFEGACFAIMEAMAMAVPVIATDIEGVRDTVLNGVTSILVSPGKTEDMAEAIRMLYRDETSRKIMGMKGRERFEQNFTESRMIKNTILFYESIMGRSNA